jgi:putative ABC transport system substrate-binding protein
MDRPSRRRFLQGSLALAGLGLLPGCQSLPFQAPTATKVPTLGILLYGTPATDPTLKAFLDGLSELGYSAGQNLALEYRYAEGRPERLRDLASELVQLKPDVIFALGGDVAPAAKDATNAIPVVVATSADPVRGGLVANLAHPGGNVTGVTFLSPALAGKRLELLKNTLPRISRVAILWNPEHADADFQETQAAAAALGVELHSREVRGPSDLDGAYEALVGGGAEGLIVVPSRLTLLNAGQISTFALTHRLPVVSGWGIFARAGGLLAYGPNLDSMVRRAAAYVDKILKGAKPADLPVEQPTTFDFVLNLQTAKALGLTIPQEVLMQATEVVQ